MGDQGGVRQLAEGEGSRSVGRGSSRKTKGGRETDRPGLPDREKRRRGHAEEEEMELTNGTGMAER